jgi:hypothetical protein
MTEHNWAEIDSWVWEAYTGNAVYCIEEGKWPEYAVTFNPDVRLPVPRLHESRAECATLFGIANGHNQLVAITTNEDGTFTARVTEPGPHMVCAEANGATREEAFVLALYAATGAFDD